jgi:hypothetical protein
MPLHVDIRVNANLISRIHIGRISGGTSPDDINTYRAVLGEEPKRYEDWFESGTEFTHRYGDGAEVCVQKAIEALFQK